MTPYLLSKFGHALLKAVAKGLASEPPSQEPRPRVRKDMRELKIFEELRQWRKTQAASEGVEPVVIMSSEVLREIARQSLEPGADPLKGLSELKRRRYGDALLAVLPKTPR
jgi:superfamily II DNA helicase RecQ